MKLFNKTKFYKVFPNINGNFMKLKSFIIHRGELRADLNNNSLKIGEGTIKFSN